MTDGVAPPERRLPAWLEPLPDAEQQRATDAWAIGERGIASLELMERAGAGLADEVRRRVPDGRVVVVAGKGNNGGDGFVVARLLREAGREVDVLLLASGDELRGDARVNFERLPGEGSHHSRPFEPGALSGAAAIVDAILGTGFSGEPREPARSAIAAINDGAGDAVVFACDVPSGVDASSGEIAGRCRSRRRDRHLPRRQAGPVDLPGQDARRRGHGHRHRHPRRGAGDAVGGSDLAAGARRRAAPRPRFHQVRGRGADGVRWLHRPHRRPLHGRRGGDARRGRLCHRARARFAEHRLRAAAARGHVGARSPTRRAR